MNNKKKIIVLILVIIGILLFAFGSYKIITSNNSIEEINNTTNVNINANNEQSKDNSSKFELKQLGDLEYYLYTPGNPTSDMPLIIYLHGATFKKEDISKLIKTDGFPKYIYDRYYGDLRAYVAIPKLNESHNGWVDISDSIENLIKSLNENYKIDLSKVSLTGHSIGGTGTYQLQIKLPNTFACIAPMSGFVRNSDENINALSKTKIWAFVGTNDTVINPNSTKQAIKLLKDKGIDAKITEYQDVDHFNVPVLGYKDKDFINWLINCGN